MHYNDETMAFMGLHLFWWIFLIIIVAGPMVFYVPISRSRNRDHKTTPFDILQKRYANGEISDVEYKHKKTQLEQDKVNLNISKHA